MQFENLENITSDHISRNIRAIIRFFIYNNLSKILKKVKKTRPSRFYGHFEMASKLFQAAHMCYFNQCKCKCICNWPLPIGAFQDQCKQIVINKHNLVKNPNWREADQLAIYKRRREVELGATENNIS